MLARTKEASLNKLLASLVTLTASLGHAAAAEAPAVNPVEAVVDYGAAVPDEAAFDAFLAALDASSHARIRLTLTIRADNGVAGAEDQRFRLARRDATPPAAAEACGSGGTLGFIDNIATRFDLTLRHPAHEHAIVHLVLGDKLTFPDQTLVCLLEGYTEDGFTPLRISGTFWVEKAEIPTAYYYLLTPAGE